MNIHTYTYTHYSKCIHLEAATLWFSYCSPTHHEWEENGSLFEGLDDPEHSQASQLDCSEKMHFLQWYLQGYKKLIMVHILVYHYIHLFKIN